jgi:foldase protein PrsA
MSIHALALVVTLLQGQGIAPEIPKKYLLPAPTADKVVAKVNGVEIKASDVEDLLWQWRGQEATNDLINYLLIKQEAQKRGVTVTEKEVEDAIDVQLSQLASQLNPGQTPEQFLEQQGVKSRSRLFLRIRTELLLNKMAVADLKQEQYVKVSTIVVRPEAQDTKAIAAAAKKADDLYSKLQKGGTWESALNATTQDPQVQSTKGLLGWRALDAFPEPARTELGKFKIGQFTKPVQTANGFQIFRVDGRGVDAKGKELDELKAVYTQVGRQQILTKLRSEAKIERNLPG